MYAKKLITINILRILQGHSDAAHPISQKEIIKYLKDEYGMEVDRKAVRRNIDFLIDAGYEIKPASPEKKRTARPEKRRSSLSLRISTSCGISRTRSSVC